MYTEQANYLYTCLSQTGMNEVIVKMMVANLCHAMGWKEPKMLRMLQKRVLQSMDRLEPAFESDSIYTFSPICYMAHAILEKTPLDIVTMELDENLRLSEQAVQVVNPREGECQGVCILPQWCKKR